MNIIKRHITKNDCYNTNRKITPAGGVIHATATPGIMAAAFAARWDKPGLEKGVHYFVDDKEVIEVLPCEPSNVHRAWHCGKGKNGSGNDTMWSMEICEPEDLDDSDYFWAAYANATDLAAHLCLIHNNLPSNVICHAEAHSAGIASNHSDVLHWFPRHGVDMDNFREVVADKLAALKKVSEEGKNEATEVPVATGTITRVQVGAFRVKAYAEAMLQTVRERGYSDAYIKVQDGLYRVQIGAFRGKDNALRLKAELEAAGFATHLVECVSNPADVAYAEWPAICNGRNINVRTSPGVPDDPDSNILEAWPLLGKGNEVDVVGEAKAPNGGLWYEIVIANEHTGYVYGKYLDRR